MAIFMPEMNEKKHIRPIVICKSLIQEDMDDKKYSQREVTRKYHETFLFVLETNYANAIVSVRVALTEQVMRAKKTLEFYRSVISHSILHNFDTGLVATRPYYIVPSMAALCARRMVLSIRTSHS